MPLFHYNDTEKITNYLKSHDKYDRFDSIRYNNFVDLLELSIVSNKQDVLRDVRSTSDRQKGMIFFGDEFEIKIESLSAALEIQAFLKEMKDATSSYITASDQDSVTVFSSNGHCVYEIRVYNQDSNFKIFVKVTISERVDYTFIERSYHTQGYLFDFSISRLEEILQNFEELDSSQYSK